MQAIKRFITEKKIADILFWAAYFIELAIVLWDKSAFTVLYEGRLFRITFALCILKILCTKYNYREVIVMVILGAIGFISYRSTGRNEMLRIVAFVMATKNIDIKKLFKVTLYVTAIGTVVMMLLAAMGVLGTNYMEADFRGVGIERRYCFGMGHPNAFYCMLLCIFMLWLYVYWEKIRIYQLIIAEIIGVVFFLATDSRTGFIVYTGGFLTVLIIKIFPKLEKSTLVYVATLIMTIAYAFISVFVNVTYSKYEDMYCKIDKVFTSRISATGWYGQYYKWGLFSHAENLEYFDMGYSRLFYWYGWIPALLCIVAVLLLIVYCYRKRDIAACIMILLIATYTLIEAHFVSDYLGRNYLIFLLGSCFGSAFFLERNSSVNE